LRSGRAGWFQLLPYCCKVKAFPAGIPRRDHSTLTFIKKGENGWWDLLKFRVVFAISGDFLAINLTTPNMRYGFSCSSLKVTTDCNM
jgi:hypothetical protein